MDAVSYIQQGSRVPVSDTKREPAGRLCPAQRQAAEQAGRSSRPVSGMLRGIKAGRNTCVRHIVAGNKAHSP
nr:MAG TPA: hypothetical protein [Bacteriophage sp.]